MNPSPQTARASAVAAPPLSVALRLELDGPIITRESVTDADLLDVRAELWREHFLRKGQPDVRVGDLSFRISPLPQAGSAWLCSGFDLEAVHPSGQVLRHEFTNRSVKPVAWRAAQRLQENGVLRTGQTYHYELRSEPPTTAPPLPEPEVESFQVTVQTPALSYLTVPLRPLLQVARAINPLDEEAFPVFYTEQALAKAERFARKGAQQSPPVETGAVLIGPLCSCPITGEFFCVVTEVLEVLEAVEAEFSLSYSGRSWTRIQNLMRAKQAACPERTERILGQAHGHNFLPNQGKICDLCLKKPNCDLTNIFVSLDDINWSRAVFSRQPWYLCHIWGFSARGDLVNGLFGLKDGQLQERGLFVLPEFMPEAWIKAAAPNKKRE